MFYLSIGLQYGSSLRSFLTFQMTHNLDIVCWNVRGLNSVARCARTNQLLSSTPCHLACLQETKLAKVDSHLAAFLGGFRLDSFAFKPANGTKGGILLLWNNNLLDLQDITIRRFSVSAEVTLKESALTFTLTVVYGPTRDNLKPTFLRELRRSKPEDNGQWLVLGDFNQIYRARDKNNGNLNLRRMHQFRASLNHCQLKEIHLQNRKYTWSNERRRPTMVRLDSLL